MNTLFTLTTAALGIFTAAGLICQFVILARLSMGGSFRMFR